MIDDMDLDPLAAEYVLGTLDSTERREAEAMRQGNPVFGRKVDQWERWFGELTSLSPDVEPPAGLLRTTLERIGADPRRVEQDRGAIAVHHLRRKLIVWRFVASAGFALAAALALWIAVLSPAVPPAGSGRYMAVLQQGDGAPAFLVSLDIGEKRMTVVPSATQAQAGRSYELWMIEPSLGRPRSLGIIDTNAPVHPVLPAVDPAMLSKASYAVTLEPAGGSPTGQPTSTPVFAGRLVTVQP